jgi:hypothetical protein
MDIGVWLAGVDSYVDNEALPCPLLFTDLRVAVAMADGEDSACAIVGPGCTEGGYHCDDCRCLPAISGEAFDDSVEELICAGFLEVRVALGCDDETHVHSPVSSRSRPRRL